MTMHVLPLHRRVVALIFPLIIGGIAVLTTPTFFEVGLPWWPLLILGLPGLLSLLICFEYWNAAIGFDSEQLHFRSVGYQVTAPWQRVSERITDGKVSLYVEACEPRYRWWLWIMQSALHVFMPHRSRYAHGLMALIPLYWFASAPDGAVMQDFRKYSGNRVGAADKLSAMPDLAELQNAAIRSIAHDVINLQDGEWEDREWRYLAVDHEVLVADGRRSSTQAKVIAQRPGAELEELGFRLSPESKAHLLALRGAMAEVDGKIWTILDMTVDHSGEYDFTFGYGAPPRLNGDLLHSPLTGLLERYRKARSK